MPFTYRSYTTKEIFLSMFEKQELNGKERIQFGDIVAVRTPGEGLGIKEVSQFLVLLVNGNEDFLNSLTINITSQFNEEFGNTGTSYDKRRYYIPFRKLKTFLPTFDISRAKDLNDIYQPFILLDNETYLYIDKSRVYPIEGVVFDKLTGNFVDG